MADKEYIPGKHIEDAAIQDKYLNSSRQRGDQLDREHELHLLYTRLKIQMDNLGFTTGYAFDFLTTESGIKGLLGKYDEANGAYGVRQGITRHHGKDQHLSKITLLSFLNYAGHVPDL